MDTNSTNQWKHSSQKPAQAGKPQPHEQRHARDGAAAARLKAVKYLNRLNQTQWQKITEYLTAKFSTQSLAKDKAINRVRTKTN